MLTQAEITPENFHEYFETTEALVKAVDQYKAGNMEAGEMFDLFKSMEEHADEVGEYSNDDDDGDRRMLRESRQLATSEELQMWSVINAGFNGGNVARSVNYGAGDDRIKVERRGSTCYIVAAESNDVADWISNAKFTVQGISGTYVPAKTETRTQTVHYQECKWKRSGWSWRRSCKNKQRTERYTHVITPALGTIGAHSGMTNAYQDMSSKVQSMVSQICVGTSRYAYGGWSRGGAIATIALAHHKRSGFSDGKRVDLITFGAPAALKDKVPDIEQRITLNRAQRHHEDPVPMLPPGYSHVGYNVDDFWVGWYITKGMFNGFSAHRGYPY
jgi:hypothetical protein